jgi:hypothetical protein
MLTNDSKLHPLIRSFTWETAAEPVSQKRAQEILDTAGPFGELIMTPGERTAVKLVWKRLNPSCAMYDAVVSIAKGEWEL